MNVLFMSAWYPNRQDSMAGLFVQKHAEAVSLYADVKVLYVHADKDIKHFEIIIQTHNSITEYLVYYPTKYKFISGKVGKLLNYLIAYKKGLKSIENELWKPDIIQANVFTRTALVAYFFGLMYHIPYVVIEHWTRYFREKTFSNFLHKFASVWVAKKASAVLPVTHHLQKWMEHHGMKNSNYQVINNVCEDIFFEKTEKPDNQITRILNVTCFNDEHKNISGILRVVKELSKKRQDFEVILVGDGEDFERMKMYAQELEVYPTFVNFTGLLTGSELVEKYQLCDFTLLFSNFENIPVVISESLACGKPVISTSVGGINEHINSTNGILIEAGDEKGLLNAIDYMIDNYRQYDTEAIIAEAVTKYSYENVGKKLFSIYSEILNK